MKVSQGDLHLVCGVSQSTHLPVITSRGAQNWQVFPNLVIGVLSVNRELAAADAAGRLISRLLHQHLRGSDSDTKHVTVTDGTGQPEQTVETEAKLTAMRGLRGHGEPAGADEEGHYEVGGGRLSDLPEMSQSLAMNQKRVDAGDPEAIFFLGVKYELGQHGLVKDVTMAVELYERAADLGVKEAHYNLGVLYTYGMDVEKDMAKAIRHYEVAAMCGHVSARYNLGASEYNAGNYDLALQHFLISAKLGDEDSLGMVKRLFMDGEGTKADYAGALRGYQKAIEEMSSPDRDEAKASGFGNDPTWQIVN
ncbi:hypothetical protein THAOC_09406 [Thalassiosira oceanica]|uniref:Uncharacterized protein n=1 Tax=Thalassiosira oceanica TaxID=159749 RepID=K0TFP6_THAOC|nr:hypothetical protein THAOC_09406 [Thalassiosira oceanica]|eukprot:EJK69347.1 hypothetical protein THAOC_09406 [Thalassiosira oceanica]